MATTNKSDPGQQDFASLDTWKESELREFQSDEIMTKVKVTEHQSAALIAKQDKEQDLVEDFNRLYPILQANPKVIRFQ